MTDPYVWYIWIHIDHQYTPNVSINLPYMDPMGIECFCFSGILWFSSVGFGCSGPLRATHQDHRKEHEEWVPVGVCQAAPLQGKYIDLI